MRSTFTDGTLLVRPFAPADARSFCAAARESARTVGPWLPWCHAEFSLQESQHWVRACQENWARGTSYEFGIFGARSGEVWGGVGVNQINFEHNFANLGYWVRAGRTGRGVASTAARWAAAFAFALGFTRLEVVAQVGNDASRRVAEKLGARFEGVARGRLFVADRACDAMMYSLLPYDE